MYTPQDLAKLRHIEARRRVRRWVSALQLGMVLFFCDQILKTWCAKKLFEGERVGLLGQDTLALIHLPEASTQVAWVSVVLWVVLLALALLRDKKATMGESISFSLAVFGGISDLVSQFVWNQPLRTLSLALSPGKLLVFNLAELAVWFAVVTLWYRALGVSATALRHYRDPYYRRSESSG